MFQAKALGRVLFDQVCKQLHLLEADYFGLEYQEPNGTKVGTSRYTYIYEREKKEPLADFNISRVCCSESLFINSCKKVKRFFPRPPIEADGGQSSRYIACSMELTLLPSSSTFFF